MISIRGSTPRQLAVTMPAEPRSLPALRARLSEWLNTADVPAELAERLVLAANEAVTNAIAHAYRDQPRGQVRLTAKLRSDTLTITVSDDGRWRPARPGEGLGGRGVLIMQESVDRVRIDRTPDGTTVTLRTSTSEVPPIQETIEPAAEQHQLDVGVVGGTTVARLYGTVPDESSVHLRRQLLTATCGGVAPLVVNLVGLDALTNGVLEALTDVARAAVGAGERVVVIAPTDGDFTELAELDEVRLVREAG